MAHRLFDRNDTYQLRGICMLMIILHHSYLDIIRFDHDLYLSLPSCLMDFGYWGTGVFFLLSGYGLSLSLEKHSLKNFDYCLSKIKKMFYPFIACWIIYILIAIFFNYNLLHWNMLIELISLSKPYSEAWFFKVIIGFYVFMFLIYKYIHKPILRIMLMLFLCTIYILFMKYFNMGGYWYNSVLNFPMGMFLAYNKKLTKKMNSFVIAIVAIILFLLFKPLSPILTSLFFSIICIELIRIIPIQSRLLFFVGTYSLAFYLMESPFNFLSYITIKNIYILLLVLFLFHFLEKFVGVFLYNKVVDRFKLY